MWLKFLKVVTYLYFPHYSFLCFYNDVQHVSCRFHYCFYATLFINKTLIKKIIEHEKDKELKVGMFTSTFLQFSRVSPERFKKFHHNCYNKKVTDLINEVLCSPWTQKQYRPSQRVPVAVQLLSFHRRKEAGKNSANVSVYFLQRYIKS